VDREPNQVLQARYRQMLEQADQVIRMDRARARTKDRRWATLVVLLLVLGTVGFGWVFWSQYSLLGTLRDQAQRSCESRNANEALLRSTWTQLSGQFADSDPAISRLYTLAVKEMQPPRDCSIFVR
jgi:hypothetical protein